MFKVGDIVECTAIYRTDSRFDPAAVWVPAVVEMVDDDDPLVPYKVRTYEGETEWRAPHNVRAISYQGPEQVAELEADMPVWLNMVYTGSPDKSPLPEDSALRKQIALYRGLMQYCPAALAAVAYNSYLGNQKHNPGDEELSHARDLSGDHADCILRHMMDGEWVHVAWRALMKLQEECEAYGAPVAPAAKFGNGTSASNEVE